MKTETAAAIRSMMQVLMEADVTVTPADRTALVRALSSKPAPRQLLTAKQAAQYLDVCVRTLQNWGKQGRLNPVPFGRRRIRWDKSEVEALAQQGFAPTTDRTSSGATAGDGHEG